MRSASVTLRLGALAMLLGAAGCSTVGDGISAVRGAVDADAALGRLLGVTASRTAS